MRKVLGKVMEPNPGFVIRQCRICRLAKPCGLTKAGFPELASNDLPVSSTGTRTGKFIGERSLVDAESHLEELMAVFGISVEVDLLAKHAKVAAAESPGVPRLLTMTVLVRDRVSDENLLGLIAGVLNGDAFWMSFGVLLR